MKVDIIKNREQAKAYVREEIFSNSNHESLLGSDITYFDSIETAEDYAADILAHLTTSEKQTHVIEVESDMKEVQYQISEYFGEL